MKEKKNNANIGDPIKEKGRLMLVPQSPITTQQVLRIFQRTPPQHIHSRPGRGGGTWEYVTATYVKKVLNYVFGWLWSFEVMSEREGGGQAVVRGRLTILDPKTRQPLIVKEQYGRADVKFLKGTRTPLDLGNDYKAAASDALKKCASELGIASDIYGKEEFKEISMESGAKPEAPKNEAIGIQPETNGIMKIAKELGAKTGADILKVVRKVSGDDIKDWRMTSTQAKRVLMKMLAYKHSKK